MHGSLDASDDDDDDDVASDEKGERKRGFLEILMAMFIVRIERGGVRF